LVVAKRNLIEDIMAMDEEKGREGGEGGRKKKKA